MSSSPDVAVLRGAAAGRLRPAPLHAVAAGPARGPARHPAVQAEVEAERAAARAAGYAAGWAEGQRAAAEAAAQERELLTAEVAALEAARTEAVHRALAALDRAAGELERRLAPANAEADRAVAAAAFHVAEAVVGRELALAAAPGVDAVRRVLTASATGRPVTVRLHPADAEAVDAEALAGLGREVTVVPDPTLESGDAVADCDASRVDARIASALDRVREVLAP